MIFKERSFLLTILLIMSGLFSAGAQLVASGERTHIELDSGEVSISLYLPKNYSSRKKHPLLVEYTGNYYSKTGSTGKVVDAKLGQYLADELNAVWIVIPFIENKKEVLNWWGNIKESITFARKAISYVCQNYNANSSEIFLIGFSRGAIGVNFIGLHNDNIADIWLGLFSHDHYDGVKAWKNTSWGGSSKTYQKEALTRFKRIKNRRILISQNSSDGEHIITEKYLNSNHLNSFANITTNFFSVDSLITKRPQLNLKHPHTDAWMQVYSTPRKKVLKWFKQTLKRKTGTFSIRGRLIDSNNRGIPHYIIQSGMHFTRTNKRGFFKLEGLVYRKRSLVIKQDHQFPTLKKVHKDFNQTKLKFNLTL